MQGGAMSAAAAGEAAYSVGMKKSPLQPQPQPSAGVRLAYTHDGTAVFKHTPAPAPAYQPPLAYQPPPASSAPRQRPMGGNGAPPAPAISASADSPKRKRGRPRKYAPDGTMPLAVVPASQPAGAGAAAASAAAPALPPGFSSGLGSGRVVSPPVLSPPPPPPPPPAISEDARQLVKKRGRPLGSANKKPRQVGTAGSGRTGLKPHVITVQAGEDVASKVMSFSRNGWAVCILSANGAVSNVTLRQAASSGATVTYEGCFEILSLSGSYLLSESDGLSSRAGGLSVSLAGPDGRVLGGGVAGPLTAASPVQVVIGSFVAGGKKEPKQAVAIRIPGASSGSSGGPGSPPNQSAAGSFNTSSQPVLSNFSWK